MTRMTCHVCGKPADGLMDISRSRGERIPDVSAERIYLCSEHIDCKVMVNSGQPLTTLEIAEVTYYGVWSGKEWYRITDGLFHTLSPGVARAQAVIVSGWFPQTTWEARAIGEDGLPVSQSDLLPPTSERPRAAAEFETHPERHPCAMCGEPAKEYVDVHVKGWMCAEHKVVKLGCVPKTGTLAFLDEYVFDTKVGYWAKELMP